ncbi:MAG: hypothetical protein ACR2RL_10460, partial [Gammaproteobacteria bacterium]
FNQALPGELLMRFTKTLLALATVAGLGLSGVANAESNIDVGAGAGARSASARVDFRIVIPDFLFVRVGTAGANNVDLVDFDLAAIANPETSLGTGTAIAATTNGTLDVDVISNSGQVTITENTNGALTNGSGGTISYSEILTASSNPALPAPVLSDATNNTSAPTLNASQVTVRSAQWTYTYANNNLPDAGTYGGVNVQNGRVTYVAATP